MEGSFTIRRRIQLILTGGFGLSLLVLMSCQVSAGAIVSNTVSGSWSNPTSWVGGVLPSSTDDVVIASGATITFQGNITVNNLTINAGGILTDNGLGTFTVSGDLTINGTWAGSSSIALVGSNRNIDGAGVISNTASLTITNAKNILSTAVLIKTTGSITINNGTTVTNSGIFTIGGNLVGANASNSVWTNSTNSTLNIAGVLLSTGILNASAAGNTVNFYGASAQNVKRTSNGIFHHLLISGASTAVKTLVLGNYTVNGNLTISSVLDANARTITLLGNWINTEGIFLPNGGTVVFGGSSGQSISSYADETFTNLTVNNSSIGVVSASNINVTGLLEMTSGNIDMGVNTLILGSSITNVGTLTRTSGAVIGKFERWVGSASSATTSLIFPVGTTASYRPISLSLSGINPGGSLIAEFVASPPGRVAPSPLVDQDGNKTYNTFRDGYWNLTPNNSISINSYQINLTLNNYTSFSSTAFNGINNNTRLLSRTAGSAWYLAGSHVPFSIGNTVGRSGLNFLLAQFCLGDDTNCSAPVTSAITAASGVDVCTGSVAQVYSVDRNSGSIYSWVLSSGGTISGQGSNRISVDWGTKGGSRKISVSEDNGCVLGTPVSLDVNVHPIQPGAITGKAKVVSNSLSNVPNEVYTIPGISGYSYNWQVVSAGGIGSIQPAATGNTASVKWSAAGNATVQVSGTYAGCTGISAPTTLAVNVYDVIYSNKTTGNWDAASTWTCNCIPGANDNVVILNGHTISINNPNSTEVKNLTINVGGTLNTSYNQITVYGDLYLNGLLAGTGTMTLSNNTSNGGSTPVIDGIGTISTVPIVIVSGRAISATALLSKIISAGGFTVGAGAVVINYGSITLAGGLTAGNTSSTWINAANASLNVGGALFSTPAGIFHASAPGNTVKYTGNVSVNLKVPANGGQYYHLAFSGNGTKSVTNGSTIQVKGNFINDGAFSAGSGTVVFNGESALSGSAVTSFNHLKVSFLSSLVANVPTINIVGDFTNAGTFVANNGNLSFNGNTAQTISGYDAKFYNLTVNNSGTSGISINSAQTILNNLNLQAGSLTISAPVLLPNAFSTVNLIAGNLINNSGLLAVANGSTIDVKSGTVSMSSPSGGPWNLIYSGSSSVTTGFEVPASQPLISFACTNSASVTLDKSLSVGAGGFTLNSTGAFAAGSNDILSPSLNIAQGTFNAPSTNLVLSGDILLNGSFVHNSGKVVWAGKARQFLMGKNVTNTPFHSMTINRGASFAAPTLLSIQGNLENNGTFASDTIVFSGNAGKTISGNTITTFQNLIVADGADPVDLTFATDQKLAGVLTLKAAAVVSSGGHLTLLSSGDSPAMDASIGPLPPGSDVTGDVTIQRYLSNESPSGVPQGIYRYLSSPVSNATVSQWQQTFAITGKFNGASTVDPLSGGKTVCGGFVITPNNPSLFYFKESTRSYEAFPTSITGTSSASLLIPGRGYAAFVRIRNCESPITVHVTGTINNAGAKPFDFSPLLSYTEKGAVEYKGYNLIGNPFPSAIDWGSASGWNRDMKNNISSVIAIRDNGNGSGQGTFVILDANDGPGQYIATGQAFWVRTTSSTATLSAGELVKAVPQDSYQFYQRISPSTDKLIISLSNGSIIDRAYVRMNSASLPTLDNADGPKMDNDLFNLSVMSADGIKMAVHSTNDITCGSVLKLNIIKPGTAAIPAGSYQLSFAGSGLFSQSLTMTLFDSFTGKSQNVSSMSVYSFDAINSIPASVSPDRFTILLSEKSIPLDNNIDQSVNVCAKNQVVIALQNSLPAVGYFATIENKVVSDTLRGNGSSLKFIIPDSYLSGKLDTVVLKAAGLCNTYSLSQISVIHRDTVIYLAKAKNMNRCGPGSITLTASGGIDKSAYYWYETDSCSTSVYEGASFSTPELTTTQIYYVSAANSLGCEGPRIPVTAEVIIPKEATLTLLDDQKTLQSNYATGNQWYKDGIEMAGCTSQTYAPRQIGSYSVTATSQGCTVTSPPFFFVVLAVNPGFDPKVKIYPNPAKDILMIQVTNEKEVKGHVCNMLGQELAVLSFTSEGANRMAQLDLSKFASGMYLIRLNLTNGVTYLRVVKE